MLAIGDILNDTFRIERLIGQGGTACVYEVSHARVPRRFALKVITGQSFNDPGFMLRFRQEADILAALDHPHLVNVLDWNRSNQGLPYLIMELLNGEDLSKFLARTGALSPSVAMAIFVQIADALKAVHAAGIVHRDLKPGNIFLCKNGPFPNFVKVLDFGIAKNERSAGPMQTDRSAVMGTPAYMSPEQTRGGMEEVDARTDQFALAAILYEMLAGHPAFYRPGDDAVSTLIRVLTEEPPPLPFPNLERAIRRAISKDKEARFPSLSKFVEATGALERSSVMMAIPQVEQAPRPSAPPAQPDERARSDAGIQLDTNSRTKPLHDPAPSNLPSDSGPPGAEVYPVPQPPRRAGTWTLRVLAAALCLGLTVPSVLLTRQLQAVQRAGRAGLGPQPGPEPTEQLTSSTGEPGYSIALPDHEEQPPLAPIPATEISSRSAPEVSSSELPSSSGSAIKHGTQAAVRTKVRTKLSPSHRVAAPTAFSPKPFGALSLRGVKSIKGAANDKQTSFILTCADKLIEQMPDQVRDLRLTISPCAPACVALPDKADREIRLSFERCLKPWEGAPIPAAGVKLIFY